MSFLQEKIVQYAFLAKAQTVHLAPAAGVAVTKSNLPEGTVAVTDMANKALAALPSTGKVKLAYKAPNNDLIWSAPIDVANLTVSKRKFIADKEQLTLIGWQGTGTDNMPVANDTSFHLFLRRTEASKIRRGVGYDNDITAQFTTDASATARELAFGLQTTLVKTYDEFVTEWSNQAPGYARIEVTSDGTIADWTGTAPMVKVTKGSNIVEFVDATGAASTGTVAAGNLINLPTSGGRSFTFTAGADAHVIYIDMTAYSVPDAGTAAQNGTAIATAISAGTQAYATDDGAGLVTIVYNPCTTANVPVVLNNGAAVAVTVTSSDSLGAKYEVKTGVTAGASFILTSPYQGETGYAVGGATATSAGVVTATNYFGIKIAGIKNEYDVYRFRDFYKNSFDVRLMRGSEPSTAKIVTTVAPTVGNGNFPQVAEDEFVSYGNFGRNRIITDMPPLRRPTLASECSKYALVQLNVKNTTTPTLVGGIGVFDQVYKLWLEYPNVPTFVNNSQGDVLAGILISGFAGGDLDV